MNTNIIANPLETGMDELEHYVLEECVKRQRFDRRVNILVTPGGRCELAIKAAKLGAEVTVVDLPEWRQQIEGRVLAAGVSDQVHFQPGALDSLPEQLVGEPFDQIVIRRGLCALPYDEAKQEIRKQLFRLKIGGKLYVSVLGLHSELGQDYPGGDTPVDSRFHPLAPMLQEKYGVNGPVCLYTERNLFMLLLEAGASVLRTLTTTYGNVKGIAVRV